MSKLCGKRSRLYDVGGKGHSLCGKGGAGWRGWVRGRWTGGWRVDGGTLSKTREDETVWSVLNGEVWQYTAWTDDDDV